MPNKQQKQEIDKLVKSNNIYPISPDASYQDQMSIRRISLEKITNTNLKSLDNPLFDITDVSTKHCENLIGKVEIPIGVAGPLRVNGGLAQGKFFIPLATTEGALVASVNRGCKAVTVSGGTNTFIEKSGITRAPLFKVDNLKEAKEFISWVYKHFAIIADKVESSQKFIKLLSVTPFMEGRNVFLRFCFDTSDAMGMNMVTFACDSVIESYISIETGIPCISLSGNVCTDKKPSWINKIEGRGHSVHAEALISRDVVKKILKTSPDMILDVYTRKILIGSTVSGSMGVNAHTANIIAAIFAATGQDLAHVVEGSVGSTVVEIVEGDLYISVHLPALPVGTIGGGANLTTQQSALSIMGIAGSGKPPGTNAKKFAEIIAGTVLAGELSLLSALSSHDLARAHRKLGRGEKF